MLALGSSDANSETGPGPDGDPQAPDVALESFVEAPNAEDCEVLIAHPITDLDTVKDCEDALDDAREAAEDQGYDDESFALEIDDLEIVEHDDREATVSVDVTQSYDVDGEAEQYEHTSVYELEKDSNRWLVVDLSSDVSDPVGPDGA
ncbi:hypothetical protein [Aeromicrobium sp.]|uniref:hypothetical protein n=1 Tax=Aeromicrobium sp. TaxID=1871063 RepID=UPI0025BB5A9D|nr:hypothetical protein [Aeromicrobium sp.]MCK5891136.1 hypothetical protein [Aeromicrobium sp.]